MSSIVDAATYAMLIMRVPQRTPRCACECARLHVAVHARVLLQARVLRVRLQVRVLLQARLRLHVVAVAGWRRHYLYA